MLLEARADVRTATGHVSGLGFGVWGLGFRVWGWGLGFRVLFGDTMVPNIPPIMENQMEKKMENEMETGIM